MAAPLRLRAVNTVSGLLLACCALLATAGHAQIFPWEPKADDEKPWVEAEIKLPPYPKSENLIQFDPGIKSSNRFYIDPGSISIGRDEVVRYTLVVKSSGGAENVSYEGMHCKTHEQTYYAYGRADRTWSNVRPSEWRRIENRGGNAQHRMLYWGYFCSGEKYTINSAKEAIDRLKNGDQAPFINSD